MKYEKSELYWFLCTEQRCSTKKMIEEKKNKESQRFVDVI